ncbi:MAG: NAD(P)-binding domain-containing protein, partial [Bacteroidaceae bacterium]|nr:NAD(P)-binding domain-containing protein [Bacteroidaceae bacterium]
MMKTVCICGGGSLGHVIAGYLSAKKGLRVNMLTRSPERWSAEQQINTPEGEVLKGRLHTISDNPQEALQGAEIVLLCLPGYVIRGELEKIRPY